MEQWKPIKNYEGVYEVSDLGRVKRLKGTVNSGLKNSGYKTVNETILKSHQKRNGYLTVDLSKNGIVKTISIHRLVAEAFCEKDDESKTFVDHINCNKHDNRASNLEWVTDRENKDRAMKNKLYNNPNKKPIYCVELDKTFLGSYEAADYVNNLKFKNSKKVRVMANKIRSAANGLQTIAYGFHWKK